MAKIWCVSDVWNVFPLIFGLVPKVSCDLCFFSPVISSQEWESELQLRQILKKMVVILWLNTSESYSDLFRSYLGKLRKTTAFRGVKNCKNRIPPGFPYNATQKRQLLVHRFFRFGITIATIVTNLRRQILYKVITVITGSRNRLFIVIVQLIVNSIIIMILWSPKASGDGWLKRYVWGVKAMTSQFLCSDDYIWQDSGEMWGSQLLLEVSTDPPGKHLQTFAIGIFQAKNLGTTLEALKTKAISEMTPRNPANQLIWWISHYLQGFINIPSGWPWDFWTINSSSSLAIFQADIGRHPKGQLKLNIEIP